MFLKSYMRIMLMTVVVTTRSALPSNSSSASASPSAQTPFACASSIYNEKSKLTTHLRANGSGWITNGSSPQSTVHGYFAAGAQAKYKQFVIQAAHEKYFHDRDRLYTGLLETYRHALAHTKSLQEADSIHARIDGTLLAWHVAYIQHTSPLNNTDAFETNNLSLNKGWLSLEPISEQDKAIAQYHEDNYIAQQVSLLKTSPNPVVVPRARRPSPLISLAPSTAAVQSRPR